MNPKEFTLKLEDRLEGAIGERGKFTGYLPNGKKGATNRLCWLDRLFYWSSPSF